MLKLNNREIDMAGRPKKEGPALIPVAVKMTPEMKAELEDIADGTGRSVTDVILAGTRAEMERIINEEHKGKPFPPSKRRLRREQQEKEGKE